MKNRTEITIPDAELLVYRQVVAGLLHNICRGLALAADPLEREATEIGVEALMREGAVRILIELDITAARTAITARVADGGKELHAFTDSVPTTWPADLLTPRPAQH